MASPLLQFLTQARSAVLRPTASPSTPLTLVLGNPSCDLDSFISATIFSFFYSRRDGISQTPPRYIPILNLPSISSSELWRLRPEFGTALRLASNGQERGETGRAEDSDKRLLENLLTISDIRSNGSSALKHLFSKPTIPAQPEKASVVLVDHNVLSIPIPNTLHSGFTSNFHIEGCVDHHVDESWVPSTAYPRIIRTGIGSCTSLVIQHLRDEGYWRNLTESGNKSNEENDIAAVELAKFSLASILIDTTNLTAEGKVSDTDREVASFLEDIINNIPTRKDYSTHHPSEQRQQSLWDRDTFYEQIASSKANSLDLLTLAEIFDRDYKAWAEKTLTSGTKLNLGIASVVKPISWLIGKADSSSPENFVRAMMGFAKGQKPELDVFVIMTTSTSERGDFQRELLVLNTGEGQESRKVLEEFEEKGKEALGLVQWTDERKLVGLLEQEQDTQGKIWWQKDDTKSRKQVAPLLRQAMRSV